MKNRELKLKRNCDITFNMTTMTINTKRTIPETDTYFPTCICCYQIRNNRSSGRGWSASERNRIQQILLLNASKPHFLNLISMNLC